MHYLSNIYIKLYVCKKDCSGMTFIFASLIELAMIGFMSRNEGQIIISQFLKRVSIIF